MLAPAQPFGQEDLVNATPPDGDLLLLVEIGLQPIERPGPKRQAQRLRVGHGSSKYLGNLLRRIGGRPPRAGLVIEALGALSVEPAEPGVDGGTGNAHFPGDLRGVVPIGGQVNNARSLDESGLGGAGSCEGLDRLALLGCQPAKGEVRRHGAPPCRCPIRALSSIIMASSPRRTRLVLVGHLAGAKSLGG